MPDLNIVKSNVAKMVSMGAPESDIDSYIQAEGSTVDQVKNFQASPPLKAMAQVAFQSANDLVQFSGTDLTKTVTGKGIGDRVREATAPNIPNNTTRPFDANVTEARNNQVGQIAKQTLAGTAGDIAGGFISPIGVVAASVKPIAMAGESISQTATNIGRYFSRIKSTFNPQAIENLNVSKSTRLGNLADISKNSAQSDINPMQQSIANIQNKSSSQIQDIGYQSKDLSMTTRAAIQDSRLVLKKNLTQLKSNLQDVAEKGAIDFQKKLPDFFEANSEAYGSARDAAIAKMASNGDGITYKQVSNAIAKTRQDAESALIPSDAPALKMIDQLEKKYAPKTSGDTGIILNEKGNPISRNLPDNANDFVDPNQLIQDLRNVKSTLSSGASAGRTGFNQEDLAVGYLDHNLGDFIKEKIPGFAQLQSDYTPVIRAMKQAHIIFKPNQGEFNTVTATNFLKKAGMGKLESGQEKLLGTLESGNKFAPGVGNISQPVKQVGSKIQQTVSEGQAKIESFQNNLRTNLAKLEDQKRKITGVSQKEIANKQALIQNRQNQLQQRLSELEGRKQDVIKLEANKKAAELIKKSIAGALTLGAGYETYQKFKK